jgi:transcription factor AP-1
MASRQPTRNFTLDLSTSGAGRNKRARTLHTLMPAAAAAGLTTPDVQMLKMTSPELAKFLSSTHFLATPTPSAAYPKTVTEEQELYAKGFEEALNNVRNVDSISIETIERATAGSRIPQSVNGITIKEEDDVDDANSNNSCSSSESAYAPTSPIDMGKQETAKLARKRLRNRIAASKCRTRKLERIVVLDNKVNELKEENADLAAVVKRLRANVCELKQEVMEHVHHGCQIMVSEQAAF